MSDQKLRDLERRWKETGSPDEEAAYLLERVRVGDLSRERLELAAYCGHEGARRVCGIAPAESLEALLSQIDPSDKATLVRAALSAAQAASAVVATTDYPMRRPKIFIDRALVAVSAWLACPCQPHLEDTERSSLALAWPGQPPDVEAAMWCAATVCSPKFAGKPSPLVGTKSAVRFAAEALGEVVVKEHVREALAAWALGTVA